jgi:hypothetical protein
MDLSVLVRSSKDAVEGVLVGLGLDHEVRQVEAFDLPTLRNVAGDFVLTLDAPLSRRDIERMWSKHNDAELVIGSRFVRLPRFHPRPSFLVNRLYRRALGIPISDFTSQCRIYRRSALRSVADDTSGAAEIAVRLYNDGYLLKEVAVETPFSTRGCFSHLLALGQLRRARHSLDAADAEDRSSQPARHEMIVRYLEVDVPVLDVGCGSSRLVQALSKAVGLDRRLAPLRYLRHRAPSTVAGLAQSLPFRDGSWPQVVCVDVPNPDLTELRRVLRTHGTLVLSGPDEEALKTLLADEGFTVDEVRRVHRSEWIARAVRS